MTNGYVANIKVNLCPIKVPLYTVGERLGENRIFGFPQKYHVKTTQDSTQMTLDVKFDLGLCFELPRSLEAAEAIRGRGQI